MWIIWVVAVGASALFGDSYRIRKEEEINGDVEGEDLSEITAFLTRLINFKQDSGREFGGSPNPVREEKGIVSGHPENHSGKNSPEGHTSSGHRDMSFLPGNGELFEEDIIMDDRLREAVSNENAKKSAIAYEELLWKDGVVPYKVAENFVAEDLLYEAIMQYNLRTCIRLRPKENGDKDYVMFNSDKNICASNVGRQGGEQIVTIGEDCKVIGTLLHEIMHVLGFVHEHSRVDRDQFIAIKWENIRADDVPNFKKYQVGESRNLGVNYNFNSVMHYRNNAFSKNGKDTIVSRQDPDLNFGQRKRWSKGDVEEINRLYKCQLQDPTIYEGLLKDFSTGADEETALEE